MTEKIESPNKNPGGSSDQWGEEYQKSVPPFNPEKQSDAIDDSEVVQKFIENDNDRQEQLIDWLKRQKNDDGLSGDAVIESERYGSEGEWVAAMNTELDDIERQQKVLIGAYQAQRQDPKFKGKTLEEILKDQSDSLSKYIGQVSETVSEEKRQELITRRNDMDSVSQRVTATRNYS
jgi:hypothetical protein